MLKYIKFRIRSGKLSESGVALRTDIRMIESNMGMKECNELLIILNALAGNTISIDERPSGFPYTFPFAFEPEK